MNTPWGEEDLWITFHAEGTPYTPTPTHTVDSTGDFSEDVQREVIVEGQPGASAPDIHAIPGPINLTISEPYHKSSTQITPFDDATKKWAVKVIRKDELGQGTETDVYRRCVVLARRGKGDGMMTVTWSITAESKE